MNEEELHRYARELLEAAMRAFHGFREERRWRLGEDISFPQVMLLLLIAERGRVSAGEVARNLCVTQGVVTRMADRLVEKGLIERKRDPGDRRVVTLTLTEKGRLTAERIENARIEDMKAVLRDLGDEEKEILLAVFNRIAQRLMETRGGDAASK